MAKREERKLKEGNKLSDKLIIKDIIKDEIKIPLVKEILVSDIRQNKMGTQFYTTFLVHYSDNKIRYDFKTNREQSKEEIEAQIKMKIADYLDFKDEKKRVVPNTNSIPIQERIKDENLVNKWIEIKDLETLPVILEKWIIELNEAFGTITIKNEDEELISELFFYETIPSEFDLEIKRIEKRLINLYKKNKNK